MEPNKIFTVRATENPECNESLPNSSRITAFQPKVLETKSFPHQRGYRFVGSDRGVDLNNISHIPETVHNKTRERILYGLRLCNLNQEERRQQEQLRLRYRMSPNSLWARRCDNRTPRPSDYYSYAHNSSSSSTPTSQTNTEDNWVTSFTRHERPSRFSDPMSFLPGIEEWDDVEARWMGNFLYPSNTSSELSTDKTESLGEGWYHKPQGFPGMTPAATDAFTERTYAQEEKAGQLVTTPREQGNMGYGTILGIGEDDLKRRISLRLNWIIDQKINCVLAENKRREMIIEEESERRVGCQVMMQSLFLSLLRKEKKRAQQRRLHAELKEAAERSIERKERRYVFQR
ncbi:unnamed protein product [Phytomonas sp. Hart1]|nr:unnamed protein product [Phytomonas sp. Hart1]|eukprot:CCW66654.1 unnamed protein product [Phytomonas sp. isolate Hart1]